MLREFIDFIEDLFPCIEPYKAEEVKKAINQFNLEGRAYNCFLLEPFDFLAQGDIIETLPFVFYEGETGKKQKFKTKGILLSNTCNADKDESLIFAPLMKIENTKVNQDSLKKNKVYRFLYFPYERDELSNYVVDFSLANTLSSLLIKKGLQEQRLTKLRSLSALGYYLFLSKLTVYFMRPEDLSTAKDRVNDPAHKGRGLRRKL